MRQMGEEGKGKKKERETIKQVIKREETETTQI